MFVLLKKQFIVWLSQLLVWIKIKNVLLEQGWAFAAKAMLLQGMGRAGGRSIYCLAFLPLPPLSTQRLIFCLVYLYLVILMKNIDEYWD